MVLSQGSVINKQRKHTFEENMDSEGIEPPTNSV